MLHRLTIDPAICTAPAALSHHLTDIRLVSACTLWTHHRQQKALSRVEWLMARVSDGGPALNRHWVDLSCLLGIVLWTSWPLIRVHLAIQQTRGIHTMLFQCWPTVFDAGPTLKQQWVNDQCLLGISYQPFSCRSGDISSFCLHKR